MPDLDGTLPSYAELAILLECLPMLLREARRARRLTTRAAGDQMHISASTITRIEASEDCAVSSAVRVLRWLDQTPREARDAG